MAGPHEEPDVRTPDGGRIQTFDVTRPTQEELAAELGPIPNPDGFHKIDPVESPPEFPVIVPADPLGPTVFHDGKHDVSQMNPRESEFPRPPQ